MQAAALGALADLCDDFLHDVAAEADYASLVKILESGDYACRWGACCLLGSLANLLAPGRALDVLRQTTTCLLVRTVTASSKEADLWLGSRLALPADYSDARSFLHAVVGYSVRISKQEASPGDDTLCNIWKILKKAAEAYGADLLRDVPPQLWRGVGSADVPGTYFWAGSLVTLLKHPQAASVVCMQSESFLSRGVRERRRRGRRGGGGGDITHTHTGWAMIRAGSPHTGRKVL